MIATSYLLDVPRGQPIKLIQGVSTWELHEIDGSTLIFPKYFPFISAWPQKPQKLRIKYLGSKLKNGYFGSGFDFEKNKVVSSIVMKFWSTVFPQIVSSVSTLK